MEKSGFFIPENFRLRTYLVPRLCINAIKLRKICIFFINPTPLPPFPEGKGGAGRQNFPFPSGKGSGVGLFPDLMPLTRSVGTRDSYAHSGHLKSCQRFCNMYTKKTSVFLHACSQKNEKNYNDRIFLRFSNALFLI